MSQFPSALQEATDNLSSVLKQLVVYSTCAIFPLRHPSFPLEEEIKVQGGVFWDLTKGKHVQADLPAHTVTSSSFTSVAEIQFLSH